ncbi:MAG: DUF1398 family protein [Bdellovibrionales bacterium]
MNVLKVAEISRISKSEKWPYPKTFNALKDAGVESYKTQVSNHELTYSGGGNSWIEKTESDQAILSVACTFSGTEVKKVIQKHAAEKTSYISFLQGIAAAGVVCYIVDMAKRKISYQGANPGECHIENVPQF